MTRYLLMLILLPALAACSAIPPAPAATVALVSPAPTSTYPPTCPPTLDDGVSPSYIPDAPVRNSVGRGHILTGVVRSSVDCSPIANVKLEFWPEEAGKGHPDETRATLFTNEQSEYRFECHPPEHIHMRISAPGYRTIGVNSYHPEGQAEGRLDIVLAPE